MWREVENIIRPDQPVSAINPDMSYVYQCITQHPEYIKPVRVPDNPQRFVETHKKNPVRYR
jgi:hypothetical protein